MADLLGELGCAIDTAESGDAAPADRPADTGYSMGP
jgi:hypothetical protein